MNEGTPVSVGSFTADEPFSAGSAAFDCYGQSDAAKKNEKSYFPNAQR